MTFIWQQTACEIAALLALSLIHIYFVRYEQCSADAQAKAVAAAKAMQEAE